MEDATQPLQEPIPEVPVSVPERKSAKGKVFILVGILLVLILGIIGGFLLGKNQYHLPSRPSIQPTTVISNTPADTSFALISYVPHFNALTLGDLPTFSDVRDVVDYNNHKVIIGNNVFVEYDTLKNHYIRQNNPDILPCIYSSAVIGNSLYVGCNTPDNETSTLSKIDMQTGKIIKQYDFFKKSGLTLVNIDLLADGTTLWISSWDGVIKMDTLSEQTKQYSPAQIFSKLCKPTHIWMEEGLVKVGANDISCEDTGGYDIAVYGTSTDSWKKEHITHEKYASLINKQLSDFALHIPQFSVISQLINRKYYLFSKDGVYTLQQMQFPQLLFSFEKAIDFISPAKAYVDSTETQAVVIGGMLGMMPQNPTIADQITAYYINLQTKEVTDLISNNPAFFKPADAETQKKLDGIADATIEIKSGVAIVRNKNGQQIASIDLATKSLSFK